MSAAKKSLDDFELSYGMGENFEYAPYAVSHKAWVIKAGRASSVLWAHLERSDHARHKCATPGRPAGRARSGVRNSRVGKP